MGKNNNLLIAELINSLTKLKEPIQGHRLAHLIKEINQMSRKNRTKHYSDSLNLSVSVSVETQPPLIA